MFDTDDSSATPASDVQGPPSPQEGPQGEGPLQAEVARLRLRTRALEEALQAREADQDGRGNQVWAKRKQHTKTRGRYMRISKKPWLEGYHHHTNAIGDDFILSFSPLPTQTESTAFPMHF